MKTKFDLIVYHIHKQSSKKSIQSDIILLLKITLKLKNLINSSKYTIQDKQKIDSIIDHNLNDIYYLSLLLNNYDDYIF